MSLALLAREARAHALDLIASRIRSPHDVYQTEAMAALVWILAPDDTDEVQHRLIDMLDALTLYAQVGVYGIAAARGDTDATLAEVLRWLELAAEGDDDELADQLDPS